MRSAHARRSTLLGIALLGAALASSPAGAVERTGTWSIGASGAWARISPADFNRRVELDNLEFAVSLDEFQDYREVSGHARYGLDERWALEGRFGFLWREHNDGSLTRRLSAKQLTGYVLYYPLVSDNRLIAVLGGGGVLLGAKLSGEDPVGGFQQTAGGPIVEAGAELEQFLSENWSAKLRTTGRYARARDVLADGTDLDLSGATLEIGLRVYFP